MTKPAPALLVGQRYSHLRWEQVMRLIEAVWGDDVGPEVAPYVDMVRTVIENLGILGPAEQREMVLGQRPERSPRISLLEVADDSEASAQTPARESEPAATTVNGADYLLGFARATAADGKQRGVGATDPTDLEVLRDTAQARIGDLPTDDATRFVLPWLWKGGRTGGKALTREGAEFGYELRLSRYEQVQVKS